MWALENDSGKFFDWFRIDCGPDALSMKTHDLAEQDEERQSESVILLYTAPACPFALILN